MKFDWPSCLSLQLYSTVTLRQGEKKHYNNKVDVYSFGIVLWELLTNRMPFEGMSNLQAAYAAAFKVPKVAFLSILFSLIIMTYNATLWGTASQLLLQIKENEHVLFDLIISETFSSVILCVTLPKYLIVWCCGLIMQQERPSIPGDIPPDLAFIVQSCWVEDPNMRPSFSQIIRMLNAYLFTLPTPSPSSPSSPKSDTTETATTSNGAITEFSARARGKFGFLRQLFAAKRAKNSQ